MNFNQAPRRKSLGEIKEEVMAQGLVDYRARQSKDAEMAGKPSISAEKLHPLLQMADSILESYPVNDQTNQTLTKVLVKIGRVKAALIEPGKAGVRDGRVWVMYPPINKPEDAEVTLKQLESELKNLK